MGKKISIQLKAYKLSKISIAFVNIKLTCILLY